jgi:integrase
MKFTQTSIAKLVLSKGKSDEIFFDDDLPGFGLRIRAGGSRKWVVYYRQGGIQRRHTVGSAAVLTVDDARKRARKVLVAVDDGKDPATEKAHKRAAAGLIFDAIVRDYLEARQAALKPKTIADCTYHLQTLWRPLHRLALSAVSRPAVAAHLRVIAKENGAVTANRARSSLSAMFAWAIGEGLCDNNPVIGTNKAIQEVPRDRVLSDAELAKIWKALPADDYGKIVKLLMLTGQRREEISGLRWSEIDMDAKLITLSGERTKNGNEHRIPLPDYAIAILETNTQRGEFVFAEGRGRFFGWSRTKAALDDSCGVKDWTLHDLRRTAATGMADLGVQPHVIEAVLNHVSGHKAGVAGIYNRSTYGSEKRAALELWAGHIRVALAKSEGANVVGLKARA